ncbi:MAG: S41 family peptidase [Bacteroidetes bacterium]|nr:S41 family peptidase [Bacteroidota bacterium]
MKLFKNKISTAVAMFLVVVGILIGTQIQNVLSDDNIYEQLEKFKDVLSLADKYYVDNVDTQKLVDAAINGLLGQLDPHSVYIPRKEVQQIAEDFRGSFDGIGIEYDVVNDTLLVVSPIAGGPSEMVGIQAGDKIVEIDGKSAIGITRDEVMKKLRGPKGTKVDVTVVRAGVDKPLAFEITRDKIPLYSVTASFMANKEVGYVYVNRFAETTSKELEAALEKLKSQGMKELVLDLRGNPGGLLNQAVDVASEFIPKGKTIVYTKGRIPEANEIFTSSGGNYTKIPLIVLINGGSASASEIVSGAIQDLDRGLIVGETSFGKGLVQRQFSLNDGSAVRITIARYYTPSGRLIQRPYGKDRMKYFTAPERIDSTEKSGANLTHTLESDSTRPVYKTASGRTVYGGGGITPDYIVKMAKIPDFIYEFQIKGIILAYVDGHFSQSQDKLKKEYGSAEKFNENFQVSDKILSEVLAQAGKAGIKVSKKEYEDNNKYIAMLVKAQIARNIWGSEGWYRVVLTFDNQFQKALTLFPEAKQIAGLN